MERTSNTNWGIFETELRGFVSKKVGDMAIADDIVQEVFLKVHANLGQLKDAEKLSPWIYKITRNSITDYFRKKSKATAYDQIDLEGEDSGNKLNECVALCLQQLLGTLPAKYREALQLAEIEDLSQIQLAAKLGISYSGAKSRVQRARRILKQKMNETLKIKTDSYGNVLVCEDKNPCCRQ